MEAFKDTLKTCQLIDLDFIGPKFTWTNGKILEARSFNHKPVLMLFDGARKHKQAEKRDFQFEASWVLDDEYQDIVRGASEEGEIVRLEEWLWRAGCLYFATN
jgi:hypothetical protein